MILMCGDRQISINYVELEAWSFWIWFLPSNSSRLCLYFLEDLKIFNAIKVFRNWHTDLTVSATCTFCIKIHATSAQPSVSN